MRKELLLLGAFGMLTTATLCAQEFHLQPTPQEYITQKDSVDIPRQYQILSGNSVQDGPALPLLRSLMPEEVLGASFRVYIGVKGDKIIKKIPTSDSTQIRRLFPENRKRLHRHSRC